MEEYNLSPNVDRDYIEVNLDLHDKTSTSDVQEYYILKQGDHISRVLRCNLTKGGLIPIDLKNSVLTLYIKKADMGLVAIKGTIVDATNGIVDFPLTRQSLAIADKIVCEVVKIGSDASTMSFPLFTLQVEDSIADEDMIESTDEFSLLNDSLAKVSDCENRLNTQYNEFNVKFDNKYSEIETQFNNKYTNVTNQFDSKYSEISSQFETKYNGLEEEYATELTGVKQGLDKINEHLPYIGYKINMKEYAQDVTDFTPVMQSLIDQGGRHFVFDGLEFNFSKSETQTKDKPYAVLFDQIENVTIECVNGGYITTDYTINDIPNIFAFYNCKNVALKNIVAKGVGKRNSTATSDLYTGSLCHFDSTKIINVRNCCVENLLYLVGLHRSEDARVEDNYFSHDYMNEGWASGAIPFSAIIIYSSQRCYIENNTILGGLRDGDLSIFGGGTQDCVAKNNTLKGGGSAQNDVITYLGQALTVDQGVQNCVIDGNNIYGYYYGIDLKADTYNCVVTNNIIEGCKCGIADRQGEATHVSETLGHRVINNKILLSDPFEKEDKFFDTYYLIGIMSDSRQYCNIIDNDISLSPKLISKVYPVCGVYVSGVSMNNDYYYPYLIANNNINFTYSIRATVSTVPDLSSFIHLKNMVNIDVRGNRFKAQKSKEALYIHRIEGAITDLTLTDNNYFCSVTDKSYLSTVDGCTLNGLCVDERQKKKSTSVLMTNSPQKITSVMCRWDNIFLITIKGSRSWSGDQIVNSTLKVKKSGSSVTVTSLEGEVSGMTFTGKVSGANIDIFMEAPRDINQKIFLTYEIESDIENIFLV